jgi:hypothetical protein
MKGDFCLIQTIRRSASRTARAPQIVVDYDGRWVLRNSLRGIGLSRGDAAEIRSLFIAWAKSGFLYPDQAASLLCFGLVLPRLRRLRSVGKEWCLQCNGLDVFGETSTKMAKFNLGR